MNNARSFLSKAQETIEKRCQLVQVNLNKLDGRADNTDALQITVANFSSLKDYFSLVECSSLKELSVEACIVSNEILKGELEANKSVLEALMFTSIVIPPTVKKLVEGALVGSENVFEEYIAALRICRGIKNTQGKNLSLITLPEALPQQLLENHFHGTLKVKEAGELFQKSLLTWLSGDNRCNARGDLLKITAAVAVSSNEPRMAMIMAMATYALLAIKEDELDKEVASYLSKVSTVLASAKDLPEDTAAQVMSDADIKSVLANIARNETYNQKVSEMLKLIGVGEEQGSVIIDTAPSQSELMAEISDHVLLAKTHFNRAVIAEKDTHFNEQLSAFNKRLIQIHSLLLFAKSEALKNLEPYVKQASSYSQSLHAKENITDQVKEEIVRNLFSIENEIESENSNELIKEIFGESANISAITKVIESVITELQISIKDVSAYLSGNENKGKALEGVTGLVEIANSLSFINLKQIVPLLCSSSTLIREKITSSNDEVLDDVQFQAAAYGVVAVQNYLVSLIDGFYPRSDLIKNALENLKIHGIEIVGEIHQSYSVVDEIEEEDPISLFISEAIEYENEIVDLKICYKIEEKETIYRALLLLTKMRDAAEAAGIEVIGEYASQLVNLVDFHNEAGITDEFDIEGQQKAVRTGFSRLESLIDENAENRTVKTWIKGWVDELKSFSDNPGIPNLGKSEKTDISLSMQETLGELSDFIDDEFLSVYREEVERFANNINSEIDKQPEKIERNLVRAIHSLKGAAGSVEYTEAYDFYGRLEDSLNEAMANALIIDQSTRIELRFIAEHAIRMSRTYPISRGFEYKGKLLELLKVPVGIDEATYLGGSQLDEIVESPTIVESNVEVLGASEVFEGPQYPNILPVDEETEPQEENIYDPDLLELFVEDADSVLSALRDDYTIWQNNLDNKSVAGNIHRNMHSLKGLGNLVGASAMGELCHEFETLFDLIIGGAITDRKAASELVNVSIGVLEDQAKMICAGKLARQDETLYHCIKESVSNNKIELGLLSKSPEITSENDQEKTTENVGLPTSKATHQENHSNKKSVKEPEHGNKAKRTTFYKDDAPAPAPVKNESSVSLSKEVVENNVQRELSKMLRERSKKIKVKGSAVQQAKLKIEPKVIDTSIDISNELSGAMHKLEEGSQICQKQVIDITQKLHAVDRLVDNLLLGVRNTLNTGLKALDQDANDSLEKFDDISDLIVKISSYTHYLKDDSEGVLHELDHLRRGIKGQRELVRDVREGLHGTRLVSFDKYQAKLNGSLSAAASRIQRRVELKLIGGNTLVDRNIIEVLNEPINHVLRNAVAHGIEGEEERKKANKPPVGTVTIKVTKEGTNVVIKIEDDGRGIDPVVIKNKALENGIIGSDDELTDSEILNLITASGFTTAESLNEVAGRGVGMDVVRNEIENVGGTLKIESEVGKYTRFTLTAPEVVGASQCMVIKAGVEKYALASNQLDHIEFSSQEEIQKSRESGTYTFVDEEYRYIHISELIGMPENKNLSMKGMVPLVLITVDGYNLAIEVDDALNMVELNVKQLPSSVRHINSITGYSELADGQPVYILDLYNLFRINIEVTANKLSPRPSKMRSVDRSKKSKALVVDDSSAYRKSTQRYLDRIGYDVATATGAIDGLDVISGGWMPDVILLDAEMPGMDGFGFAQSIRAKSQTKDIPIIMITSRSRDKFENKAKQVGIDVFMNKPFEEDTLRSSIDQLLMMEVGI